MRAWRKAQPRRPPPQRQLEWCERPAGRRPRSQAQASCLSAAPGRCLLAPRQAMRDGAARSVPPCKHARRRPARPESKATAARASPLCQHRQLRARSRMCRPLPARRARERREAVGCVARRGQTANRAHSGLAATLEAANAAMSVRMLDCSVMGCEDAGLSCKVSLQLCARTLLLPQPPAAGPHPSRWRNGGTGLGPTGGRMPPAASEGQPVDSSHEMTAWVSLRGSPKL